MIRDFFICAIVASLIAFFCVQQTKYKMVCTSESMVVDIISLEYRDATIKLANGQIVKVNQATLKKGDSYCLRYEKEEQ